MIARTRFIITAAVLCHLLLAAPLLTSQLQSGAGEQQPPKAGTSVPAAEAIAPAAGEPITIRAQQQEKAGNIYDLRGDVEIDFRTYVLKADEITYNEATGDITARGHIVFDGGPHDEHLTATRAT